MGGDSCRRTYPGLHHGTVDQELLLRNEYLAAENRVLGGKLKGRRRKRRTELLHRGSLGNCHLCDRFNFLTIRGIFRALVSDSLNGRLWNLRASPLAWL